jgi:hypothetical protein
VVKLRTVKQAAATPVKKPIVASAPGVLSSGSPFAIFEGTFLEGNACSPYRFVASYHKEKTQFS